MYECDGFVLLLSHSWNHSIIIHFSEISMMCSLSPSRFHLPPAICYIPPTATTYYHSSTAVSVSKHKSRRICGCSKKVKAMLQSEEETHKPREEEEEEEFQVLTAIRTNYNHIVIVDTPKSRLLLLDSTRTPHSPFFFLRH